MCVRARVLCVHVWVGHVHVFYYSRSPLLEQQNIIPRLCGALFLLI